MGRWLRCDCGDWEHKYIICIQSSELNRFQEIDKFECEYRRIDCPICGDGDYLTFEPTKANIEALEAECEDFKYAKLEREYKRKWNKLVGKKHECYPIDGKFDKWFKAWCLETDYPWAWLVHRVMKHTKEHKKKKLGAVTITGEI